MKPEILIEVMCDGFTLSHNGFSVHIGQEDDPSKGLAEFFEHLKFGVRVEEVY